MPSLLRCMIATIFTVVWCAGAMPTSQPAVPRTAKIRIVLAGDSTVTEKAGWGTAFTLLLSDNVECVNFSRGGRSSMSFIKEGTWAKVLACKPDYVFIQFG